MNKLSIVDKFIAAGLLLTAVAPIAFVGFIALSSQDAASQTLQGRDETLLPYQQCMDKCKIHYERGVNEGMRQAAEYCLVYGGFVTEDADGMRINVKCSVIIE